MNPAAETVQPTATEVPHGKQPVEKTGLRQILASAWRSLIAEILCRTAGEVY